MADGDVAQIVLDMEREAFRRWAAGDVDGFLEISDPEVTYFDPFIEKRLDGLDSLKALYDQIRGSVRIDRYELIDPKVQSAGDDAAILTFAFESWSTCGFVRWNTTEVYRRGKAGWKIVHTHWAFNRPRLAGAAPAAE